MYGNINFLNASKGIYIEPNIRGSIDGIPFDGSNVIQNSFRISNQCAENNKISFGSVYVGELDLTLSFEYANTHGNWIGKTISCEYGLKYDGSYIWIPCPSGVYHIAQATWTNDGLAVIAYDNMSLMDKPLEKDQIQGAPYNILSYICRRCGVELANTEQDIIRFVNGSAILGLEDTSNVTNFRDVLSFVAQILGGFATCNREGKIEIRRFVSDPVDSIDETRRFAGCTFADEALKFTQLTAYDDKSKSTKEYHKTPNDGFVMELGKNPLMQLGTESFVKTMRTNLLNEAYNMRFYPFTVTTLGTCAYDLGDVIRFTGGISHNVLGCIMQYSIGLNDFQVSGFGSNKRLQEAKSKEEKNQQASERAQISGLTSVQSFTNVKEFLLDDEWVKIGQIAFNSANGDVTMFHGVTKFDLVSGGNVQFMYKNNGQELDFIHDVRMDEGVDTATLFIPFTPETGVPNRFEVFVKSETARGSIAQLDAHGAIIGAGITSNDWDGVIVIEDMLNRVVAYPALPRVMSDEMAISMQVPTTISAEDILTRMIAHGIEIKPLTERMRITMRIGEYPIMTEDGEYILTEDGDTIYSKGGFING